MGFFIVRQFKIILKNKRGTALFLALMILTGMITIALGTASVVMQGIAMSRTENFSSKAYFAAEAGAERILWEVRKNIANANFSGCGIYSYVTFSNGSNPASCGSTEVDYNIDANTTYFVQVKSVTPTMTFWSTGNSFDVRRTVEVSY